MTRQSSIYSTKQRREVKKFSLIKNARDLVNSEIIYKMFPPASMKALDEKIELPTISVHDYVASISAMAIVIITSTARLDDS